MKARGLHISLNPEAWTLTMDNRDRDKFYSSSSADDDDDGEDYELEPPDATVLAAEEQRAKEVMEASQASVDIDEIYRDVGRERTEEIVENWFRDLRQGFRFQVKHLLFATAVLAIVLTLAKWVGFGTVIVVAIMLAVATAYFFLQWQEKKAEEAAHSRRQEMFARQRAHFDKTSGRSAAEDVDDFVASASSAGTPAKTMYDEPPQWSPGTRPSFSFQFSMSQLMIAMTVAAVIFGLVHLSGASNAATLLGFVALIGLVVHALGVDPPAVVILGWWLILVLYVVLSLGAALWSSLA
jgi:hypothetical protein